MPTNSPLTKTPMPSLADAPNIETATHPGFTHLEKYSIPRFTNLAARNAAFSTVTPDEGQLIYVKTLDDFGYQVWDGSEWVEFGEYCKLRDITSRTTGTAERTSSTFADVPKLSCPVGGGVYRVELNLVYATANNYDTDLGINFAFPGSTSRLTIGVVGRGSADTSSNTNTRKVNLNNNHARVSGDSPFDIGGNSGGGGGLQNSTFALFVGQLVVSGSGAAGNFRVQFARRGAPGPVRVYSGSILQVRKIP